MQLNTYNEFCREKTEIWNFSVQEYNKAQLLKLLKQQIISLGE